MLDDLIEGTGLRRRRCAGRNGEEDIKLFVVLKSGHAITANDIQRHCAERMAKFMVPKRVAFLDEMPRTPTGKPEKGKLAKMGSNPGDRASF
jgi:carnitine-CoA ligase